MFLSIIYFCFVRMKTFPFNAILNSFLVIATICELAINVILMELVKSSCGINDLFILQLFIVLTYTSTF